MGLDNRFMGHFKNHPEVEISLAYFRKYFNLNDWMLQHCAPVQEDNPYDVIVTKGNLKDLLKEIEPIAQELNKFNYNQISYYEDNGYPQEFVERFYDTEFTPSCSNTFAAGHKLVKLYRNVLVMIEMLEDNEEDFYITFYSSF